MEIQVHHCLIFYFMKKKILSALMTLAVCLTIGYNYSAVKESTSLSNSLKQLASIEFATAEDDYEWDCEPNSSYGGGDWLCDDGETYESWSESQISCDGNAGPCTETYYYSHFDCEGYLEIVDDETDIDC